MFKVNDQGRVALVSGAGSERGIGMAIARRLGAAGVKLIITASSARIAERVAELRAEGFDAHGRVADLTDEHQVHELGQWAESLWGRIDILVNNAGMAMQGSPEPFSELASMDLHTWNLSLARNLTSAFLLTRAVLPGITLQSPKITRNLTTAWFAQRVDERRQRCMNKAKSLPNT